MQTHRALGKGLASLIPISGAKEASEAAPLAVEAAPTAALEAKSVETVASGYFHCALQDIVPARAQPRKIFAKEQLEGLADSIREQGILQPLLVRRLAGGKYELIAGERRWRASQMAGLTQVPVVVTDVAPEKVLELALVENLQREDLNPIETALAYRELQDKHHLTQDEIAQRVGKERSSVANHLRLLGLPEEIRGDVIAGRLSMGQARALLALERDVEQLKLKRRILEEGLSVRQVEEIIREAKRGQEAAPPAKLQARLTPQLKHLQERMTQALGTKVKLKGQGQRGQVVIEYYSAEDLDRLFQRLS